VERPQRKLSSCVQLSALWEMAGKAGNKEGEAQKVVRGYFFGPKARFTKKAKAGRRFKKKGREGKWLESRTGMGEGGGLRGVVKSEPSFSTTWSFASRGSVKIAEKKPRRRAVFTLCLLTTVEREQESRKGKAGKGGTMASGPYSWRFFVSEP